MANLSLHGDGECLTISSSLSSLVCRVMICSFLIANTTTRSDNVESLQAGLLEDGLPVFHQVHFLLLDLRFHFSSALCNEVSEPSDVSGAGRCRDERQL